MPKLFRQLIIVWSVVCASGLAIFLFQVFGPAITPQTAYDTRGLALALTFFAILWAVPVTIAAACGRRQDRQKE